MGRARAMNAEDHLDQGLERSARQARARALQSQLRAARLEQINTKLSALLEGVNGDSPRVSLSKSRIRRAPESSPAAEPHVLSK